ncbi:MupA/Atu3671 family FMN-dependent luciferase-like monooxygenase [Phenylobacterium sp. NIBR 498073]|uniref:MupA/Atu3671 family FMN-dependent luciferase-like monooxygenase n=1 Tax=Phenylobacterium sp. NIBR 498073 TaxID=3015177 RepID=UPI0022B3979A|nr:MupA/Atu3671 family FMN-dependent luciferase-like monooxygenase [Phenylobacterium sp. NIBR 498073]WGU39675.1 LLM class flavin-dependent oxidoreductase [Phenylobacterium sp. NIBR 498073]
MSRPNAYFVGDGTLLIRCAEAFLETGGQVAGVVSAAPQIIAWAQEQGHVLLGTPDRPELPAGGADYLFSVANLSVLGPDALAAARVMAINFHDGPLPERGGLNTPAWAILEGADEHAVTWHEMLAAVDAGRVLKSRRFAMAPNETTFSLNLRCYEAGEESFRELLADLAAGRLEATPLSGARGWYGRAKRPAHFGILDFRRPTFELGRTVRALDFGARRNALGLPKLLLGERLVAVRKLERAGEGGGEPGQILALDETSITVMAGDGAIVLSGLSGMAGEALDPMTLGVAVGAVLPAPAAVEASTLRGVGASEGFWEDALENAHPLLPPFPRDHAAGPGQAPLAVGQVSPQALGAAWAAWLVALTGQSRVTLAMEAAAAGPALSRRFPVTVDLDPAGTAQSALAAFAQALARAQAEAPMAADLPLRLEGQAAVQAALAALAVVVAGRPNAPGADLTLSIDPPAISIRAGLHAPDVLGAMAADFSAFCNAFLGAPQAELAALPLGGDVSASSAAGPGENPATIHALIAAMAREMPDAVAVEDGGRKLTYAELEARATRLAGALAARGARAGSVVGLYLGRSADLVVSILAVLKTGAAYLPLDPSYPADRIAFMLEDSAAALVVADTGAVVPGFLDPARVVSHTAEQDLPAMQGAPGDLAYLIYTSGSTGRPKGVMIEHRNVTNFFAGMDRVVPLERGARLLAVTSMSFDISVLELLWTLTRGATIVLQGGGGQADLPAFSLFYFAAQSGGADSYRVLFEGARFADENGFEAIWTPERHFHEFGGLYPSPAISSAALAGMTKNVKLRAGSVVAPLHHPVSIAESWALVDNLSGGRVGIAIASGWQPNDFILRPENFADRKSIALGTVETLRRLWAGEAMEFPGPDGKPVAVNIHPRPVQKEIPVWITAAGNIETFAEAGRLGCGVLTHLLGQSIEELKAKIAGYRQARAEAGFEGPGHVVLMLHTFVSEDEETVLATARQPMKSYLNSAVDLVRRASWTFPTFVSRAEAAGGSPQDILESQDLTPEELDALLDHAFERYYRQSGLFGTPETAKDIVREVTAAGVDEIACLIDFGIESETVLANLKHIRTLMSELEKDGGVGHKSSVAEDILQNGVTHLQCTPSMAAYLAADAAGRRALQQLECLMVGGEALPPDLARELRAGFSGRLLNMYGPTETTIWSSVARLDAVGERVPLGEPIANTDLSVRAPGGQVAPRQVEGELWIAGAGVSRGYWRRPELTAERFVERDGQRWYRTGDLVRMQRDGALDFLGRTDNQVKVRGHRIELGEIEAVIAESGTVRQVAVKMAEFGENDVRLLAYVTPGDTPPSERDLRARLADKLPEFMRPSQIVILERMPMTPNGKIDRKALPLPKAASERGEMVAAAGDMESAVAAIWRDALGLEEISVTENVFDLGAHSLLAVQVQRRMKQHLARDIAITDIFRFPTVRAIAAHLSSDAAPANSAADRGAARAAARLARMGRR